MNDVEYSVIDQEVHKVPLRALEQARKKCANELIRDVVDAWLYDILNAEEKAKGNDV